MTTATLLAGSLVLATSCATAQPAEQAASSTPDAPVAVSPVTTAPTKEPQPVKPTGNAVDVRKVGWTKAKPIAKGKKVQLTWWSGVAPCTVLHKVKVKETAKKVTITLYEGTAPKARNVSCIMIAVEKTTTVKLKKALGKRKIVDGSKV
ncbi:hypothetical protein [Nonomuraea sp. SYSU D8015]|uniref:hypothetical protein n=1 Tax=Nonomuraea sp. SYSU D8015 TaxID=2593644 RepID=UPI001CB72AFF|nr:hypothetical protein [Nonomuraea sp. SYSU D8015]